jgi:alpha-glucosidase (family GH31 glycosyl hydrolase)
MDSLKTLFYTKRPFILSDASAPSSGKYASGHSIRNLNTDDFAQLGYALSEVLQMNMYGIPMTGADVCSYYTEGKTDWEEICARWVQMHAYLPFVRQHYPL